MDGRGFSGAKSNLRLALLAKAGKSNPYLAHRSSADEAPSQRPLEDEQEKFREFAPKVRVAKPLKFIPRGKYIGIAKRLRQERELEELKQVVEMEAKKVGMEMDLIPLDMVPTKALEDPVEWWDAELIAPNSVEGINPENCLQRLHLDTSSGSVVTQYVQIPLRVPKVNSERDIVREAEVVLTPAERRKLRKQRRLLAQQDKQDMQRLGLLPKDEPRLRVGNVMRVLGSQSVIDPTEAEALARKQTEERRQKGLEHDKARQLTKTERQEKLKKKYKLADGVEAVRIAVFRIQSLKDSRKRFKLRANAVQLFLTGAVVVYHQFTAVVVEGSHKSINFYKKLLLNRIDWSTESDTASKESLCSLLWEGESVAPHFADFSLRVCPTLSRAQSIFEQAGCLEYFKLCQDFTPTQG